MKYDGFIFDVDGVLIDTSQSFNSAVLEAVAFISGSDRFTLNEIRKLKSITGFNNDWHVAIAGVCWAKFDQNTSFDGFIEKIQLYGSGITGIRKFQPKLTPSIESHITRICKEAYGGSTACKQLYNFEPSNIKHKGHWLKETPLTSLMSLIKLIPLAGIFTGRSSEEMELGFDILKWRIPPNRTSVSDDEDFDKPNPGKLINLIDELECVTSIYFGDSFDDLQTVRNYRQKTGRSMDFCYISTTNDFDGWDFIAPSVNVFIEERKVADD